ncbi:MAG: hypothetical protein NT105_07815 [Verrucomicrobia bacterium]|nr:hypothetical protein [Verrucomicrobiota bacterium]
MANKEYIEDIRAVIGKLHECGSTWVESVPVHEVFRGQTAWKGVVEVFDLIGHPKAKRCYAWSHLDGERDERRNYVTVLEIPPVESPQTAVKVAIAGEIRNRRK